MTTRPGVVAWPGRWAIVRLEAEAALPEWASRPSPLTVAARTADELSIVTLEAHVPDGCRAERGFRVLALEGPIPFSATGLVAGLTAPLASAGIGVFPIATYETDYVLVRDEDLEHAVDALRQARWIVNS